MGAAAIAAATQVDCAAVKTGARSDAGGGGELVDRAGEHRGGEARRAISDDRALPPGGLRGGEAGRALGGERALSAGPPSGEGGR